MLFHMPKLSDENKPKSGKLLTKTRDSKKGKSEKVFLVSNVNLLANKAKEKKQNRFALEEQITKIDAKLAELARKMEKAIKIGGNTTVLDSLILKCAYRRTVVFNMIREREQEREEKAAEIAGKIKTFSGEYYPIRIEPAIGDKNNIPSALPRQYKVKRRVLKDKPSLNGTVSREVNLRGATTITERKAYGMKTIKPRKPHVVRYVSKPAELLACRLDWWRAQAGFDHAGFLVM